MENEREIFIKITKNGPYEVYGKPRLVEQSIVPDSDGASSKYSHGHIFHTDEDPAYLCRCGKTHNAPFCDGDHEKTHFNGRETASFEPLLEGAEAIKGPIYTLMDNESYCSYSRFCDADGRVWNLTVMNNEIANERAIQEACDCPSGRLVMLDNDGNAIEPILEKSISALEDTALKVSGPLWVKGGIRVESENGFSYEARNRQTLCRCGYSGNKPFCNGAHASVKFKAKKADGEW